MRLRNALYTFHNSCLAPAQISWSNSSFSSVRLLKHFSCSCPQFVLNALLFNLSNFPSMRWLYFALWWVRSLGLPSVFPSAFRCHLLRLTTCDILCQSFFCRPHLFLSYTCIRPSIMFYVLSTCYVSFPVTQRFLVSCQSSLPASPFQLTPTQWAIIVDTSVSPFPFASTTNRCG